MRNHAPSLLRMRTSCRATALRPPPPPPASAARVAGGHQVLRQRQAGHLVGSLGTLVLTRFLILLSCLHCIL